MRGNGYSQLPLDRAQDVPATKYHKEGLEGTAIRTRCAQNVTATKHHTESRQRTASRARRVHDVTATKHHTESPQRTATPTRRAQGVTATKHRTKACNELQPGHAARPQRTVTRTRRRKHLLLGANPLAQLYADPTSHGGVRGAPCIAPSQHGVCRVNQLRARRVSRQSLLQSTRTAGRQGHFFCPRTTGAHAPQRRMPHWSRRQKRGTRRNAQPAHRAHHVARRRNSEHATDAPARGGARIQLAKADGHTRKHKAPLS